MPHGVLLHAPMGLGFIDLALGHQQALRVLHQRPLPALSVRHAHGMKLGQHLHRAKHCAAGTGIGQLEYMLRFTGIERFRPADQQEVEAVPEVVEA